MVQKPRRCQNYIADVRCTPPNHMRPPLAPFSHTLDKTPPACTLKPDGASAVCYVTLPAARTHATHCFSHSGTLAQCGGLSVTAQVGLTRSRSTALHNLTCPAVMCRIKNLISFLANTIGAVVPGSKARYSASEIGSQPGSIFPLVRTTDTGVLGC